MVDFKKLSAGKLSEQASAAIKPPTGFDPSKVKVKRHVTLPVLKHSAGKTLFVTFTGEIHKGKEIKELQGGQKMEPADLANVTNLEDGKPYVLIMNAVLHSNLVETYPDAGYMGLSFSLTKHPKRDGKKYHEYEILEIEF